MELLTRTLFLCFALSLTHGAPAHPHEAVVEDAGAALPDRCEGLEFDAITPDEKGTTFFFKGSHLWNGFHGPAQLSNELFKELDDDHNIGHVDAAFRMHNPDNTDNHDHIYFFLDDKVFSYYNHTLEDGYPKQIQEDFPGIPSHLDAAVECPRGECMTDSVLFFQGNEVHVYDIATKSMKTKSWPHLPVCTSAFRWLEHYYCFHGHNFTRFHPVSGEVSSGYPKDARNYFMRCPNFGHGSGSGIKCSDIKLDAITSDDTGKTYAFSGPIFMRLDSRRDGFHAFPITRNWPEMTNGVDAVFSYTDKMYMIKDEQVYIYKGSAHYTLIDGYPKSLKEELNIEGHVDAAFICPNGHTVHIIQGDRMLYVDPTSTPRTVTSTNIKASNIDAAYCGSDGVVTFTDSNFFKYPDVLMLNVGHPFTPNSMAITPEMCGCQN
ncbi:hemopexin [Cheilinus undulatus]|uniref:hemopexin n=1 Tax=Cheilinus undulatus TaxID=241271 RepID=UPI001BD36ED1|nr:hemopexin [Cheilinus undulatus]